MSYVKNGTPIGGTGGTSLPTASAAGQVPLSDAAGTAYTATDRATVVQAALADDPAAARTAMGAEAAGAAAAVTTRSIGAVPTTRTVAGAALSGDVSAATIAAAIAPVRTIDANHVYVWRCDDAAGAGTVVEASAGPAMSLTGSSWVQGDGGLYAGGRSLHLVSGAAGTDRATSGTITPPANNVTIELDFSLAITNGITFGASQTGLIGLNNGGTGNYVFIRLSWSAGAAWFMGGWKPNASAEQSTPLTLSGSAVLPGMPHHAMLSITRGVGSDNGTMSLYLDGALVGTTSSIYNAGLSGGTWVAVICNAANNFAPLMRVGEVRVSNVARDAAYARAAYATLIARH